MSSGYGIFTGRETQKAVLRFSPNRASWVAEEEWHPKKQGHFDEEGYYHLTVPFSDPRELLMDILRHGSEIEVREPDSLRDMVKNTLESTLAHYDSVTSSWCFISGIVTQDCEMD